MNYSLRIGVCEDGEVIFDTSYNKGQITKIAETVGLNPIKALLNIEVAKKWIDEKCVNGARKVEELQSKESNFSEEKTGALRNRSTELANTILTLRNKIENEKRTFVDESRRIRYRDILDTTFSKAQQELDSPKIGNNVIKLDI